jgi:hypothetical protein
MNEWERKKNLRKKFKSTHSHTIDEEKKKKVGSNLKWKRKKSFSHHRIRKKNSHWKNRKRRRKTLVRRDISAVILNSIFHFFLHLFLPPKASSSLLYVSFSLTKQKKKELKVSPSLNIGSFRFRFDGWRRKRSRNKTEQSCVLHSRKFL